MVSELDDRCREWPYNLLVVGDLKKWRLKEQTPGPLLKGVNGRRSSPPQNCPQRYSTESEAKRKEILGNLLLDYCLVSSLTALGGAGNSGLDNFEGGVCGGLPDHREEFGDTG